MVPPSSRHPARWLLRSGAECLRDIAPKLKTVFHGGLSNTEYTLRYYAKLCRVHWAVADIRIPVVAVDDADDLDFVWTTHLRSSKGSTTGLVRHKSSCIAKLPRYTLAANSHIARNLRDEAEAVKPLAEVSRAVSRRVLSP